MLRYWIKEARYFPYDKNSINFSCFFFIFRNSLLPFILLLNSVGQAYIGWSVRKLGHTESEEVRITILQLIAEFKIQMLRVLPNCTSNSCKTKKLKDTCSWCWLKFHHPSLIKDSYNVSHYKSLVVNLCHIYVI